MRTMLLLLAVGCGASAAESRPAPTARSVATPEPSTEATPTAPAEIASRGTIVRGDLIAVLDAGLGRFLQGVTTEPHMEGGRFIGFRLIRLYPDDPRFASLELQPGDTVTRINGIAIERPEHALEAWSSLRVASQLLVEYLHDGEPRELRFEIVD